MLNDQMNWLVDTLVDKLLNILLRWRLTQSQHGGQHVIMHLKLRPESGLEQTEIYEALFAPIAGPNTETNGRWI